MPANLILMYLILTEVRDFWGQHNKITKVATAFCVELSLLLRYNYTPSIVKSFCPGLSVESETACSRHDKLFPIIFKSFLWKSVGWSHLLSREYHSVTRDCQQREQHVPPSEFHIILSSLIAHKHFISLPFFLSLLVFMVFEAARRETNVFSQKYMWKLKLWFISPKNYLF